MSRYYISADEILQKHGCNLEVLRKDPNKRTLKDKKAILDEYERLDRRLSTPLRALASRNGSTNHINHKIFHLLTLPYTYINAYAKISKNKGALTKGVQEDEEYIKSFGLKQAYTIAAQMKNGSYTFAPVRRVEIPKPGKPGKMRPIDTPTQKDRIVQEALRGILESIFEPEFRRLDVLSRYKAVNTGFRPNYCSWDNMQLLSTHAQRARWCIEGDIVGAYNNVNHGILIRILRRRIKDERFLNLIDDLLKSGIMHADYFINSFTGTPQGGIVSPLLFNIYMFELDNYIFDTYIEPEFQTVESKKPRKDFMNLQYHRRTSIKKMNEARTAWKAEERRTEGSTIMLYEQYKETRKTYKDLQRQTLTSPSKERPETPSGFFYSRYADDWILCFDGTHDEALSIRQDIGEFINSRLKMQLDKEKTLIADMTKGFKFLGFETRSTGPSSDAEWVIQKNAYKGHVRTKSRTRSWKIQVRPDAERLLQKIAMQNFTMVKGEDHFYPIGKRPWAMMEEFRIVERYKAIFTGICMYYRFCQNPYILNRVSYILQYSCAKTISARRRIPMPQVFKLYGKSLAVSHVVGSKGSPGESWASNDPSGSYLTVKTRRTSFVDYTTMKTAMRSLRMEDKKGRGQKLFNKNTFGQNSQSIDPFRLTYYHRTKMKVFSFCCICGESQGIEQHHIGSLRRIPVEKRKRPEYIRQRFDRLQIPVCRKCHEDITHGRYSDKKPLTAVYDDWIAKL